MEEKKGKHIRAVIESGSDFSDIDISIRSASESDDGFRNARLEVIEDL
jgi:hypothetical protein